MFLFDMKMELWSRFQVLKKYLDPYRGWVIFYQILGIIFRSSFIDRNIFFLFYFEGVLVVPLPEITRNFALHVWRRVLIGVETNKNKIKKNISIN